MTSLTAAALTTARPSRNRRQAHFLEKFGVSRIVVQIFE
jgi:hypothetical protein